MARRSKRVAARKSISKRGKAARKVGKHATAKKRNKLAKRTGKKLSTKTRHSPIVTKARKEKWSPTPAPEIPIETSIIDAMQELAPRVVVVSELEPTRNILPDPDEENRDHGLTADPERPAA
jgi:hypothetical protein